MKKIIILATLTILMVGCTDKQKSTKLYNQVPSLPKITADSTYCRTEFTSWGERIMVSGVTTAEITKNSVFLNKYIRKSTGAGVWDQNETVFLANGYDSLLVEFYSPADEKSYNHGGTIFYGPYTISLWFGERMIVIEAQ